MWKKDWVAHSEPVGSGETAFKYLAPYVFRVAISNSRIVKLEEGRVTFKYKESATEQMKYATVSAEEFMRRFLQHVLPERFVKVRYYGLLSPGNRHLLDKARQALMTRRRHRDSINSPAGNAGREAMQCPNCGSEMTLRATLKAKGRGPPS